MRRFLLHETESCFFLTGIDKCYRTCYSLVLQKVDDTKTDYSLKDILKEDKSEYSQEDYTTKVMPKRKKMFDNYTFREGRAFLILGFIRFLKGYYLVLVTRRKRIAKILRHSIYTVKEMKLIPLFNTTTT
jgi:hypothetical protein